MEKSTIQALIIAGATLAGGVVQALILSRAKRKRRAHEAAEDDKPAESAESPKDK